MQDELNVQVEIEELFKKNRARLREDFRGDHNDAARACDPIIERKMVARLMKSEEEEPSSAFNLISKRRLNYWYGEDSDRRIYDGLSARISQNPETAASLLRTIRGEYVYYRFFSAAINPIDKVNDSTLRKGRIKIFGQDGYPQLHHWSPNWDQEEPEHQGFVFQSGLNMFMLSMSAGVMRLAICNIPNKIQDRAVGIMTSLRKDVPHNPFGARFIMVRKENTADQANLDGDTPESHVQFHDMTGAGYAWLMLSHHPSVVELMKK